MRTAITTKLMIWEVQTLASLQDSKVYGLCTKLNNRGRLNREEKKWLTREVNNTYFKSTVSL